jgi:hypothetical protein
MSLIADYLDRRYDLLSLRGGKAAGLTRLSQTLFDEQAGGQLCVGAQKLAQRWVLEFLTERGSLRFLPKRGSEFMTQLRQGRLRTETDVIAAFNFAAVDVRINLINEEYAGMPDDERMSSAELLQVAILADNLQLTIQLTTQAGDARRFIVPISTKI